MNFSFWLFLIIKLLLLTRLRSLILDIKLFK